MRASQRAGTSDTEDEVLDSRSLALLMWASTLEHLCPRTCRRPRLRAESSQAADMMLALTGARLPPTMVRGGPVRAAILSPPARAEHPTPKQTCSLACALQRGRRDSFTASALLTAGVACRPANTLPLCMAGWLD